MDGISIFIGVCIGIIVQRFFNVTKMIAIMMKNFKENQQKQKEAKLAKQEPPKVQ